MHVDRPTNQTISALAPRRYESTDGKSVPYEERVRLAVEACKQDSVGVRANCHEM